MNIKETINYISELCYGETGREIIRQLEDEELGYFDYQRDCSFLTAISRLCDTYYPIETPQYAVFKETIQAIAKYYRDAYPNEKIDDNQKFQLKESTSISNKLTRSGKMIFQKAKYPPNIKLENNRLFFLESNGTIKCAYGFNQLISNKYMIDHDDEIVGEPLEEGLDYLLKENCLSMDEWKEIQTILKPYQRQKQLEQDVKTAIMYQIMEDDQTYYGTRRAYFFALEYNGDLTIPIKYGLSTKDPNLLGLIQHYKEKSHQTKLYCYPNKIGRKPEKVRSYSLETIENVLKKNQPTKQKRIK